MCSAIPGTIPSGKERAFTDPTRGGGGAPWVSKTQDFKTEQQQVSVLRDISFTFRAHCVSASGSGYRTVTYGWKGMKCCLSSSSIFPVMMSVTSITGGKKAMCLPNYKTFFHFGNDICLCFSPYFII